MEFLNLIASEYYDKELKLLKLIEYEAKIAKHETFKEYISESYFDFYKISKSMQRTKRRFSSLR
ncbi:hypothetical protein IJ425_08240 [bacterium]|nr:hypothetical protein [bacterium]